MSKSCAMMSRASLSFRRVGTRNRFALLGRNCKISCAPRGPSLARIFPVEGREVGSLTGSTVFHQCPLL